MADAVVMVGILACLTALVIHYSGKGPRGTKGA